jgi:hypothetical protein
MQHQASSFAYKLIDLCFNKSVLSWLKCVSFIKNAIAPKYIRQAEKHVSIFLQDEMSKEAKNIITTICDEQVPKLATCHFA